MQSSNKLSQSKRKYNEGDKRNKRIASGTRTSRRLGTKSVASRRREQAALRKQAQARRESRNLGRALSAGQVER